MYVEIAAAVVATAIGIVGGGCEAANVLVMHSLGIGSHVNTLAALSHRLIERHGHKVGFEFPRLQFQLLITFPFSIENRPSSGDDASLGRRPAVQKIGSESH